MAVAETVATADGTSHSGAGDGASSSDECEARLAHEIDSTLQQSAILTSGRRGSGASLRDRARTAVDEASFPALPAEALTPRPFALPNGFVDDDAPLSARQWERSLSLATAAAEDRERAMAQQRKKERLEERRALIAARGPVGIAAQAAAEGDAHQKRTRKPTAVMKANTEVARLMGGGDDGAGRSLQHLSAEDLKEEAEKPQHLSTTKGRERAEPKRESKHAAAASSSNLANGDTHRESLPRRKSSDSVGAASAHDSDEDEAEVRVPALSL